MPETEVSADASAPSSKRSAPPKARRRQFSMSYKRDIIEQFDNLDMKERGQLLRREGLYYSHLTTWRKQLRKADKKAKIEAKAKQATVSKARYDALKKQLEQANAELERANRIIAVQKKLSDLLFINSPEHSDENSK